MSRTALERMDVLSRADDELAARDRDLAALPLLLDPDALTDLLRPVLPWADLREARATYLRYKPRTSCLATCHLEIGGRVFEAYVKAYAAGGRPKLDKVKQRTAVTGPVGLGRVVLDDEGIVVSMFPNDLSLRGLVPLADPEQRASLLRDMLPNRRELWSADLTSLRYKPERRYVGRLVAGGVSAVVRAYTHNASFPAPMMTRGLRSAPPLRLPRWLGFSNRKRVVAVEWLDGRLLSDAFGAPALSTMGRGVGRALALLHAQEGGGLPVWEVETGGRTLLVIAQDLSFLAPRLSKRIDELTQRVVTGLREPPPAITALHGDFHAGQVVLAGDGVSLLDLDRAARGDPMIDVAQFLAHLEWDVLRSRVSRAAMEELGHALLEGYAVARPLGPRLAAERAAALIRLAPHPFRERRPDWDAELEAILKRAEEVIGGLTWAGTSFAGTPWLAAGNPSVPIDDPTGAAYDEALPFLPRALDPRNVRDVLRRHLSPDSDALTLAAIRIVRHKPGRRCLIEYDLRVAERMINGIPAGPVTLVGKVRAKGLDTQTFDLHRALWKRGFDAVSPDGISVPYAAGLLPEFHMWVQVKAPGLPAAPLLAGSGGPALASRIGTAIAKVHQAGPPSRRHHTIHDELQILESGLARVAYIYPRWAARLDRIRDSCRRLAASLPSVSSRGIHRDFYADHVLVDAGRLWLIDFDLYARGDPAVDLGNFLAHMMEHGLRTMGDPDALGEAARALQESYLAEAGGDPKAIQIYTALSLARHIYLSTQFPDRRPFTGMLMDLYERAWG